MISLTPPSDKLCRSPKRERAPIRIAFVVASMQTEQAGTEGHLLRLIRSLDRSRFEPHLVVLQRSRWTDGFQDATVPMSVLGFRSFKRPGDWCHIVGLARLLRHRQIDVVELYFTDAHFLGSLAAALARVPVVISCRRDSGHGLISKDLMLKKLGNRFVTRFLANSQAVADRTSQLEGMSPGLFEVIPNGIDLAHFDRQATGPISTTEQAQLPGKRTIVAVANLRPVKNLRLLLTAFCNVAEMHRDVMLLIIGAGSQAAALKKYAADIGIRDRVVWTGCVPSVAPYLAQSCIGCLSSDSEGFANAIIEYMAASLPVVATRVGGAAEAVIDGYTGWLVPQGDVVRFTDALLKLLNDPVQARQMGAAGRKRVERYFTFERQVDAYQRLYQRLLSNSNHHIRIASELPAASS